MLPLRFINAQYSKGVLSYLVKKIFRKFRQIALIIHAYIHYFFISILVLKEVNGYVFRRHFGLFLNNHSTNAVNNMFAVRFYDDTYSSSGHPCKEVTHI